MENTNTDARKAAIDFLNAKLKFNKPYSDQKLIRINDAVEIMLEFAQSLNASLDKAETDEAVTVQTITKWLLESKFSDADYERLSNKYGVSFPWLHQEATKVYIGESRPATLDKGAQFVKASERMPTKPGRYVAKRFGEYIIVEASQLKNGDNTGKFVFCVVGGNRAQWNGYKSFEWLDESLSEQPEAKDCACGNSTGEPCLRQYKFTSCVQPTESEQVEKLREALEKILNSKEPISIDQSMEWEEITRSVCKEALNSLKQ